MSKAPFMPLATDALIADTTHLNTFEFGCYVKLLMAQWRNNGNPLENNDKRLSYMMGITKAQFKKVWPTISQFYLIEENTISQQRIAKDFNIVMQKVEKNKQNGSKGGIAKSLKTKELGLANATVSLLANGYQPEPEPEPLIKELEPKGSCQSASTIDAYKIMKLWNDKGLGKLTEMMPARRHKINSRTKDRMKDLQAWDDYFQMFIDSSFLSGQSGKWKASFDWALNPTNMAKVLEGNYKNDLNGFDVSAYIKTLDDEDMKNEN